MPLSADQRQQIVLEMEARGLDAASLVAHALEETEAAIRKNAEAYEKTDQAANKTIQTFERLAGVQNKLQQLQAAAAGEQEAMAESIQKVDVGWAKLVVTAIKYKDSLEAVAAATTQMTQAVGKSDEDFVRIDVALNKLIVDSFRHLDVLRQQVVSLGELGESAARLKSDRIVDFYANTAKLTREFEASVVALGQLDDSAAKLKSDRIDQFYVNTAKLAKEFESSVVAVGQLGEAAARLKSDRIDQFYVNTEKLTKEFEASVVALDQLGASAARLKSDRIDQFYVNTAKLAKEFEATVVSVDQLGVAAAKLKSDRIDQFYVNTEKLKKEFEATVISVDQLAASTMKFRSDRIEEAARAADRLRESFQRAGKSAADADALIKSMSPRQLIDLANATDKAQDSSKRFGYGILNISHAIQDAQYGFGAVLNNIPLVTQAVVQAVPAFDRWAQSLGGASAVAGGFMIAGVAIDQLLRNETIQHNLTAIGRAADLIRDPLRDASRSIEGLKEQIQGVNDRPLKVQADYDAMRKLTVEVDAATRAMQEWEAMKLRRSTPEEKAKKEVSEAMVESRANVVLEDVLREQGRKSAMAPGSELHGKIASEQATIDFYRPITDKFGVSGMIGGAATARIQAAQAEINRLKNEMELEQKQKIADMVDMKYGEASRQSLEDTVNRPGVAAELERRGVDMSRLQAGLELARPENLFAEEKAKRRREEQKKEKEYADRQEDLAAKARAQMVGVMDRNEEEATRAANRDSDEEARDRARRNKDAETLRNKADRDAERLDNAAEAPARVKRQAEASYGQEFQSRARKIGIPVGGAQATIAGKDVARMVAGGADVDSAMQQALANLGSLLQRQNMTMLRSQAAWEQLNQMIGPATLQLQALQQRQGRVQQQRRTNGVH